MAQGGLDGQHGGRRSPAGFSVGGRARERVSMGEMRQGRESGCKRGSKRAGASGWRCASILDVRAWWSIAVAEKTVLIRRAHDIEARARGVNGQRC